ncbi:MAG: S8 family serine peptidase, partial [Candidatus Heimdallarchaeota archaeon]
KVCFLSYLMFFLTFMPMFLNTTAIAPQIVNGSSSQPEDKAAFCAAKEAERPLSSIIISTSTPPSYPDSSLQEYYNLAAVHNISTGAGVRVLLIDKPIDKGNTLLQEHLINELCVYLKIENNVITDVITDYDNNYEWTDQRAHGTRVAGIIAQMAPNARIMCLGIDNPANIYQAIEYLYDHWADFEPDIISISITAERDADTEDKLRKFSNDYGAFITLAVGNIVFDFMGNVVGTDTVKWPANSLATENGIMGVGAIIDDGDALTKSTRALFSRVNPSDEIAGLEIMAPGERIFTTDIVANGGSSAICEESGTSFAAPVVAGIAALKKQLCPSITPEVLEYVLTTFTWNPNDFPALWTKNYGYGIANCPGIIDPNYSTDHDTLSDLDEIIIMEEVNSNGLPESYAVDFQDSDTDDDGLLDSEEIYLASNGSWLTHSYPNCSDSDNDELSDGAEVNIYGTDPLCDDSDGDGLTDAEEVAIHGTNPNNPDTDGDGIWDGDEVNTFTNTGGGGEHWVEGYSNDYVTDPLNNDTDDDGITDWDEIFLYDTNPTLSDTDGDGLPDLWELTYNSDPTTADSTLDFDDDYLTNYDEFLAGTNPRAPDTDGDGLSDGWEVLNDLNPLTADAGEDPDSDGLTNLQEYSHGTKPNNADTDADGMPDGWEVQYALNPLNDDSMADNDNDGLFNIDEYSYGSNPTVVDTDGDGLTDKHEILNGCDPTCTDTDGDGWCDSYEVNTSGTDPADADSDNDGKSDKSEFLYWRNRGISISTAYSYCLKHDVDIDGLTDGWEISHGLDPLDNDCDNDGLLDGLEIQHYQTNPKDPDSDHDGYTDLTEISNDTDPNDANDYPNDGGGFGF